MNTVKNWAIVILGITCLCLYWNGRQKDEIIKTCDQTLFRYRSYELAVEEVLDDTCRYIEDKYNEYLPDTLWENDIYAEYSETQSLLHI